MAGESPQMCFIQKTRLITSRAFLKSSTNLFLHPAWAATAWGTEIAAAPATATAAASAVSAATSATTEITALPVASSISKEVQAITDVQHGIAGDGIHLTVCPTVGIDGAREVGLLVQDIVPLEHHGEFLATQEGV